MSGFMSGSMSGSMPGSMSAPSIPNLLSLRAGRGGRGARGARGRGAGPSTAATPPHRRQDGRSRDTAVRDTDNDAAVSRLSAVDTGYLHDPFARPFVRQPQRRMPIINRGTYARTAALDAIVDSFLASATSSSSSSSSSLPPSLERDSKARYTHQIISLGAGSDTRCMRLFSSPGRSGILYHEIDFPAVTRAKLDVVAAAPELCAVVPPDGSSVLSHVAADSGVSAGCSWASLETENACQLLCHGIDLRALAAAAPPPPPHNLGISPSHEISPSHASPTDSDALPVSPSLSPSPSPSLAIQHLINTLRPDLPTLLLSECCLCYLEPADAASVMRFFCTRLPRRLAVALYEPTRPDDAFGRVMASNLAARGLRMPTLAAFPHPSDQESRLRAAGFDADGGGGGAVGVCEAGDVDGDGDGGARCVTVAEVWDRWVSPEEKARLDALEGLDEVEEWTLLAEHYVVAWGWKGSGFDALAGLGVHTR